MTERLRYTFEVRPFEIRPGPVTELLGVAEVLSFTPATASSSSPILNSLSNFLM